MLQKRIFKKMLVFRRKSIPLQANKNQKNNKKGLKNVAQTSSQSTVNKIEMRLGGKERGSMVFQQDYADCGTPSAVKSGQ